MSSKRPTTTTHDTLKGSGRIPTPMMVGELLDGRYELREIIGEGGMGVVFRATQLSVNRDVAIKVMKSDFFEEYGLVRRFKLEMEIISGLQHPNIVRLLDTGQDKRLGVFFLVMEFIEGVSLGELIYEHAHSVRLKPELTLEIAIQICSALTEPHRLGVVHRDLKPDNIILMIRSDEQLDVKLLDFGVARIIEPNERLETSDTSRLTATGGIVGTPPYIAPELCESSRHVSAKSDLYAVGALLFELLTGVPPFQGRSTAEVLYKHVHEDAPRLLDRTPLDGCNCQDLDDLIAALLQKNPDDRPESALHVKRALDKVRQNNHLHRPMLHYTTMAPTVESFHQYITRTDDLPGAIDVKPAIPTRDSYEKLDRPVPRLKPPPLRTMAEHEGKTLTGHTEALNDMHAIVQQRAHSSTSMEPITAPDLGAMDHDELHISPPLSRRPGMWIGVIVLLCGLGALFMVLTSQPVEPRVSTLPMTVVEESVATSPATPPAPEQPELLTLSEVSHTVTRSSSHIMEAVERARDALPAARTPTPPPERTGRDKKTPAKLEVEPAEPVSTPHPPELKKKFDWLYKK